MMKNNIYCVFISRRYGDHRELKKVFDNPESATEYHDYLSKGLEKQSPYKIEIKEITMEN